MSVQTDAKQQKHGRAVTFFWAILIGATVVSLTGNVVHAVLPHVPEVAVRIGAAAVPPVVLLAAVHGIAVAVRAGASGTVYRWAVAAVALIGVGAFIVSFLALRDLMTTIGYSAYTAWIFPMIIDTAVAVSTLMLVALGDKPVRRKPGNRSDGSATTQPMQSGPRPVSSANAHTRATADNPGGMHPVQAIAPEDEENLQQHLSPRRLRRNPWRLSWRCSLHTGGVRPSTRPPRNRGLTTGLRNALLEPPRIALESG